VIAAGYALGAPLAVRTPPPVDGPAPPRPPEFSMVSVADPGFVVETVKSADDGRGIIVRGYEALGGGRRVRLTTGMPCSAAVRTDLLERDGEPVELGEDGIDLAVRAFEIVTLRLLP
jgi:alpha-mannosidase